MCVCACVRACVRACAGVWMGQRYSTRDKTEDKEIQRRITVGWTAFAKHRDIFKGNIGTYLKRQVYKLMRISSNDIRRGNMGMGERRIIYVFCVHVWVYV